jgi:hypothetical protein
MTETAQPETAAESEVASDPIADAANAFKTFDENASDKAERARNEKGQFVSEQAEEIEADEEADADSEAESHDETNETDEAADEAQPEAVDLPPSWPSELAEEWNSLPAPLQDKIVQREAEREAAVNAKFQEAANVRKANEALIAEANTNRQKFIEAADTVLAMVRPQRPPTSMLNRNSSDYDPDTYHLLNAQADEAERHLSIVQQQRQQALAQFEQEVVQAEQQEQAQIEEKTRPALLKDVPDLSDPQKQPAALTEIVRYAVQSGIPERVFADPEIARGVTSAQIHLAWKAMQWDKQQTAKAKVTPRAPKPAAPVVRPGVTTSRSAVENAQRKKAFERLDRSGSIEDAAAIFKHAFKG